METSLNQSAMEKPIRYIKGVGERLSQVLAKKKIFNIEDALFYFPRSYEDRRRIYSVRELKLSEKICVVGKIKRAYPVFYSRSRRRAYELLLEDIDEPQSKLVLKWFHKPYVFQKLDPGCLLCLTGEVQQYRGRLEMLHPEIEILGKNIDHENLSPGIIPIYSQTEGLYQKTIRKIERNVVRQFAKELSDPLPEEILAKYNFPHLSEAVATLHCPPEKLDFEELKAGKTKAHQRLIYQEFFMFSMAMALNRRNFVEKPGISFSKPDHLWDQLKSNLSFKFTTAQKKVLSEILKDMESKKVMYRMIQGDVGCGKTVVAAASALIALESNYQVAMMAPTEVLVEQHVKKFEQWFKGMGISCFSLTGSLKAAEKKKILERLATEEKWMVFGTHALFEEAVQMKNLGLVIVDEQHRFGVRQRARLVQKGKSPDVLVMTATPIPRTLALTIYGDLDISLIDEMPPGRKSVVTKVFTEKQRVKMNTKILGELKKGRQVYIVFPLIEDSEKLALRSIESMWPKLEKSFLPYTLGRLHGRMEAKEKADVLEAFRKGEIQVLVSTTVIEVGIDIPNASVMIVENAERFGLSQLHQLRGRVGRGDDQSYCFLMASHLGTADIVKRLKSMEKIQDGFQLSEVDLEMRGPGEFLGTKQSGVPDFQLAQLPRDLPWLHRARSDAFQMLDKSPELKGEDHLQASLRKKFESFHLA